MRRLQVFWFNVRLYYRLWRVLRATERWLDVVTREGRR